MSRVEVLVTTMFQSDFSKYRSMNLQTDTIIANQTDSDEIETTCINGNKVTIVSTSTRGVSRNRNTALAHSNQKSDYILFSDDDLIFNDGYEKSILDEFHSHPEAEAIKFNLHDLSSERRISMRRIEKFEKATRRNMSSSGVCGIAVKTDVIKKYNIHFHENFGPGTENFCGEDTIFIMGLIDKKVRCYRSPIDIAGIDQTGSTWFKGYTKKYFVVTGKVLGTIYPFLSWMISIYSAYKFSKRKNVELGYMDILRCYFRGIKEK